jgi:hypothetical protein
MDMNRWLYRAAGTVGIAGGFLLLGAGSAQADEAETTEALLGDVFSPTSGLPPLDLPVGATAGTPDASALTLDPDDGRLGQPELLPGLPALPTGGLDSLLGGLPLGGLPLDAVGAPGGVIGGAGPLGDAGALGKDLVRLDGDPIGLPTRLQDTDFRTLPAPAPIPPASDAEPSVMSEAAAAGEPEIVGAMPFLTEPIKDTLLPGDPLSRLSMIGALVGQVPAAGPIVNQNLSSLPLVHEIVPTTQSQHTSPASDPLTGPITGVPLQPVIAQELAAEHGQPELLGGGGLPLIGNGLNPLGQMFGVGNLPAQLPLVGPLAGPLFGNLPVVGDADPAKAPGPAVSGQPALPNPLQNPDAVDGERPIAGEDPEYAESSYPTASPEQLPGLGGLPLDPLSVLQSLPLVGPLTGSLPL